MCPLLWFAWCWFAAHTWSVDARCGQPLFGCQAILVSFVVSTMLAALLFADFEDVWLWFPSPVPLRCLMALAILIRPLAKVYPRFLLPSRLRLCGSFHPFPSLAPGFGIVRFIGLLGLVLSCLVRSPPTVACPAAGGCCLAYVRPMFRGLLCGWDRGAWLCTPYLLVSSSRGGCRTQGRGATALCAGWCVLLATGGCYPSMPLGGWRRPLAPPVPLAPLGGWHLPLAPTVPLAPFLGMQASPLCRFMYLVDFTLLLEQAFPFFSSGCFIAHSCSPWCASLASLTLPTVACLALGGFLRGLASTLGGFLRPWSCGAWPCVVTLLGSSPRGGSRTQGCDAKAPRTIKGPCAAKAPRAGWCVPIVLLAWGVLALAMVGAFRPI
ncbi:hypothetical protein GQ457_06G012490 [Hibiscus cannabinus]